MNMKYQRKSIVLSIIILGVLVLGACKQTETNETNEPIRAVKAYSVNDFHLYAGRSFPAVTKSVRTVDLAFRVSGPLVALNGQEGRFVRKNERIAEIDRRDFELNVQSTKALFDQAQAEMKRYERLYKANSIPENDFEIKVAQYKKAKTSYEQAKNALDDTYLIAPFSGYIGKQYTENYEEIQAKQPIISLIDLSTIEIRFHIPENILIKKSEIESFKVRFENFPNMLFDADLKEVGKNIEPEGFPVTLSLNHKIPEGSTINDVVGLACRVILNLKGQQEQTIAIPVSCLFENPSDKNPMVWKIDNEKLVVSSHKVTIGDFVSSDYVEITSGVSKSDLIVSAGVHFLEEGQEIRLLNNLKR